MSTFIAATSRCSDETTSSRRSCSAKSSFDEAPLRFARAGTGAVSLRASARASPGTSPGSMGMWFQRGLGGTDPAHPSSAGAEVLGNWIYPALREAYEGRRLP